MHASDTPDDPRAAYDERLHRFVVEELELDRADRGISWLRLATFVLALVALGIGFWGAGASRSPWFITALVAFLAFLLLVGRHTLNARRQRRVRAHVRLNRTALHRLARTWEALAIAEIPDRYTEHAVARDLALFGRASLFQILGQPGTRHGRETLAAWLSAPADADEVAARQEAVDELAPLLDMRHELNWQTEIAGRLDPEGFLEWAEGEPWLMRHKALVWIARIMPLALVASIVAQSVGAIDLPIWGMILFVNLVFSLALGERVHGIFDRVSSRKGKLSTFEDPFATAAGATFRSERLRAIVERMANDGEPADRRMRKLSRLVELAGLHHSQMTYLPIQAVTMWDFHVLWSLERWQAGSGRAVRRWLAALGELEALAALATLRFDEPAWTFPTITTVDDSTLTASELGHPLIADGRRVANDVAVGPEGTFLLVTGSNMSGKSTLLRAIGLNVVLAQAGAPVCAAAMSLPPLELATSIVIEDSLEDGVSFFMAELRRLREVVLHADACHADGNRRLLYLLDEILRGTNAVERQIAARRVIAHLVDAGAIGAVSTHDTGLAAIDELVRASVPVHFQETIESDGDGRMTFDYRLRPGLATTTNALKLLELVGLAENPARDR
jgi:hypothetical protein